MNTRLLYDNIYTTLTGKYTDGKTELDFLSATALSSIFRKKAENFVRKNHYAPLTESEESEIRGYFAGCPGFSTVFHRLYKGFTGEFHPEYIPDDLYYSYIEPFMTDRRASRYMDNKCYYPRLFPDVKMPPVICNRTGRIWTDADGKRITAREALDLAGQRGDVVVKAAENSQGGQGLFFLSGAEIRTRFKEAVRSIEGDITVQELFLQHEEFEKLHPGSVNTVRILSFLPARPEGPAPDHFGEDGGTRILSMAVRIGTGQSRVDNVCSGGLICGVNENGALTESAFSPAGSAVYEHPDLGYAFSGITLPGIDSAVRLVKQIHPRVGKFRLSSWDIAVDRNGEAALIEANFSLGIIMELQAVNGPLFGGRTPELLREVFGKRR